MAMHVLGIQQNMLIYLAAALQGVMWCVDIPVLGNQGTGDLETSCPVHRKPLLSIILEIQQV